MSLDPRYVRGMMRRARVWDCVGVCYGVPDFGERVVEDMPQADPDGDCARIPPTWFRPSWASDPSWADDPKANRCPPGYEAIGLRCMGPCGGYWCRPATRRDGFGQTSEIPGAHAQEGAFPVGVAAVVFGVILGGFVLSFFVKRSPAGRWRLER